MPEAPAQFVDISLQRFLRVLLGLGPWQQTPDNLLEIPHPHRDVKPVKYRRRSKWKLTIDALDPIGTVGDHREPWVRRTAIRLDKTTEPLGQVRQLASHVCEEDVLNNSGRRPASGSSRYVGALVDEKRQEGTL